MNGSFYFKKYSIILYNNNFHILIINANPTTYLLKLYEVLFFCLIILFNIDQELLGTHNLYRLMVFVTKLTIRWEYLAHILIITIISLP